MPSVTAETVSAGIARLSWLPDVHADGFVAAVGLLTEAVTAALEEHERVEALVDPADTDSQRIATWSGLHREGVLRGYTAGADRILYARLRTDVPVSEPVGFRTLLNSFLPRKRAIGQVLIRDPEGRVLLCQLTYKKDWDLPGGVVEVGESPQLAAVREAEEELGLVVPPGDLLLTDWLPPWGGWDDAICLVFDGGVLPVATLDDVVLEAREIRAVAWCTPEEVAERAADFTARRIASALARLEGGLGGTAAYAESGR